MANVGTPVRTTATPIAVPTLQALMEALGGVGDFPPHAARETLAGMGEAAMPALRAAMRSTDAQFRWEAAKALAEIASPRAAGTLVAALEDRDGSVRWLAAEGLVAIGPPALDPLLHALLRHSESAWLREGAHHVLCRLAHDDLRPHLEPIVAALESVIPAIAVLPPVTEALKLLGLHGYGLTEEIE